MVATPAHPFCTQERGWVPAGLLRVGERVRKATGGWGTVRAVRSAWDAGVRYNLTVAGANTYAVGDGDWVVHNSCYSDEQQAFGAIAKEAAERAKRTGKPLTVDDAETLLDWAGEVEWPGRRALPGDVNQPSNWPGPNKTHPPHIHLPNTGGPTHIPVDPGVKPRPPGWR